MVVGIIVLGLSFAAQQPYLLQDCLAIGTVGVYGRTTAHTDAIEAKIVAGVWKSPQNGSSIAGPGNTEKKWAPLKANAEGWFDDAKLRGGYASFQITRPKSEIVMLESVGNSLVYVNGVLRTGDPYATGQFSFPIELKAGANELLFQVGRGRLRVSLRAVAMPHLLDTSDSTLPDILEKQSETLSGAVVVTNATNQWSTQLKLVADVADAAGQYKPLTSSVGSIPPLSAKKVPIRFRTPSLSSGQDAKLLVRLLDGDHEIGVREFNLRVRKKTESYRVTIESAIDGSVQYYAVQPSSRPGANQSLFLSLHGASVEAQGQAEAYSSKSWGNIVCATNRRPFGFDWEDWGRQDAMEVLDHATKLFQPDLSRIYLTGHSMGGHGTWQLGVQYPDRFAAIGPSAGWSSFYSYGGKPRLDSKSPIATMINRAELPSDTNKLLPNLSRLGVYILHGDADDNVPVTEARSLAKLLSEFHFDWMVHEQKGVSHWWDASPEPGADCVDWAPMFDFFSRRAIPTASAVRRVQFVTAAPSISATRNWVTIEQQQQPFELSTIDLTIDPLSHQINGTTTNVETLRLDLAAFDATAKWKLVIDGDTLTDVQPSSIEPGKLWIRKGSNWTTGAKPAAFEKSPERSGPFKNAFDHRAILVVGTQGNNTENEWALTKARYDSETFWVRGNGRLEVIRDKDFEHLRYANRSVILYGNKDTNSAWTTLLGDSPIVVGRSVLTVGTEKMKGSYCALFVRPRKDSKNCSVGVIAGTDVLGMQSVNRIPFFVSGVAIPDFLIGTPAMLETGIAGFAMAGYFDNKWQFNSTLTAKQN